MENLQTGLKHRNDLLSAILQCDGMTLQYLCELIEEYNLDVSDAVSNARETSSGISFDTLTLYLLIQAFDNTFISLRAEFDPDDEYDLDEIKFRDWYVDVHLNKMDSKITIKKKQAIQDDWPKEFVNRLSQKVVNI